MVELVESGESVLLQALSSGRATLLLGQRYSEGALEGLLDDLAAAAQLKRAPLIEMLAEVDEKGAWDAVRRALDARDVPSDLLEIASNPWALVLTSAVDALAHAAFERANGLARGLRVLYAGQSGSLGPRTAAAPLTLMRLFGSLDETEAGYRPPTTRVDLRRRTRFDIALVLRDLSTIVGARGALVVVGVGDDDWLELDDLALAAGDLPPQTIHWFQPAEGAPDASVLGSELGDAVAVYSESLDVFLRRVAATPLGETLAHSRQRLLHPAERTITVGSGDATTVVTFRPDQWKRLSQVVAVLDDSVLTNPPERAPEIEKQAFREFLRRPQRIPDWEGVARGYLFERARASEFVDEVEASLRSLGSVLATERPRKGETVRRTKRLPLLVTGPPASGKSRLLHWAAVELRRRGHVVLYVLPSRGRGGYEQIERACRLVEERTGTHVVVIADHLEPYEYEDLNEVLASSGRRAVVVGAAARLPAKSSNGQSKQPSAPESRPSIRPFPIDAHLLPDEVEDFAKFLGARHFANVTVPPQVVTQPHVLLFLYWLLPESRGNLRLSLLEEYERLLTRLDAVPAATKRETGEALADWQTQLASLRDALVGAELEAQTTKAVRDSALWHDPAMRGAIHLALFCAALERPISLDLLLRSIGPTFLRAYPDFARAVEDTALLQEAEIDGVGTVGLDTHHQFVADLALNTLVPDAAERLRLLGTLIDAVAWDDSAHPGERVDQDYVVALLQALGPRGQAALRYSSRAALNELTELLAHVRTEHDAHLPPLLLVEANALRELADWTDASFDESIARCERAAQVLDRAEGILVARRASNSRNAQLQNVLTTRAAVSGFVIGACLRRYRDARDEERVLLRGLIDDHLERVRSDTTRARSLRASYYPLDVSFWAHRDLFEQLPDLSAVDRATLVARMQAVLDIATEEPIEPFQVGKYEQRLVELARIQGRVEIAEAMANEMAQEGNFAGVCLLARREVFDPVTKAAREPEAAARQLERLETYRPAVLGSPEAVALMHRLWLAAHLPGQVIGGSEPVRAACSREAWLQWRQILEARLALPDHDLNPYVYFCLAWTLLQLDEPVRAVQLLRDNETLAAGNRRRVGSLAVITKSDGEPIEYTGTVRRVEGNQVTVYVPGLLHEIKVPGRVQSELALASHVGDEWRFFVSLNYQGILPWLPSQAGTVR